MENKIQYTLVRSRRKTIGITITKEGDVKVSVPLKATEKQISEIVNKKTPWILNKLEEIKKMNGEEKKDRQFIDGERFLFCGVPYILKTNRVQGIKKPEIILIDDFMHVSLPENNSYYSADLMKKILRDWYVEQFEAVVRDRIPIYSELTGARPQRVTIREQKTRWGSCSTKGNINLNWKLIMAPPEVLDYVIVHELSHMKQMNHSKKFWDIVGAILPGYFETRKWLKTNSMMLESQLKFQ